MDPMLDFNSAFNDAWSRTKFLLFENRGWARWWRYMLLTAMTGGSGGGGGGNFSGNIPSKLPDRKQAALTAMVLSTGALSGEEMGWMGIAAAIVVVALLMGAFFGWLSCCAQLIYTENLIHDRHELLEPFGRRKGQGLSFFLWMVGVALAVLIPTGLVTALGAGVLAHSFSENNPLPSIVGGLGLLFFFLFLLFALGIYFLATQTVIVPLMVRQNLSAGPAWRLGWETLRSHKLKLALFLLLEFAINLGGGIAAVIGILAALVVGGLVLGLVFGIPAFLCYNSLNIPVLSILIGSLGILTLVTVVLLTGLAVQTPVTVLGRCFAMYCSQQIMPQYGYLPPGGRPLQPSSEVTISGEGPTAETLYS